MLKIANHLSTKVYLEKEDLLLCKPVKENALWCYLLENLGALEFVMCTYEPVMFWLSHCKTRLEEMLNFAKQIERDDIEKMLANWLENHYYNKKTTLIMNLSTYHRHELGKSLLPFPKDSKRYNWKDLASLSGFQPMQIEKISNLENNSIKTMLYYYEKHGNEDINTIKFEARKYNVNHRERESLERTLRKIVFKKSE